jgi:hypothetical protein
MPALFLVAGKIKRRTMRRRMSSSLPFNDLRWLIARRAPKSVNDSAPERTKLVGFRGHGEGE